MLRSGWKKMNKKKTDTNPSFLFLYLPVNLKANLISDLVDSAKVKFALVLGERLGILSEYFPSPI